MKNFWIVAVMLFVNGGLEAKGLDELTPEVEETKTESKDAATPPAGETAPAPKAEPVPEKKEEPQAEAAPKAPEPSATSKKLADRLMVFTGASFTQISGPDGDWGGGGTGDVSATWLLKKDPFPTGRLAKIDVYALARYAPQDVVVESKGQSYRGVVQTLQAGLMATRPMTETFRYVTQATLGYATTNLRSTDVFQEKSKLEAGGAQLGLGGGADWVFAGKASVGPRLNLGFGRYQTIGIGGEFGFVF